MVRVHLVCWSVYVEGVWTGDALRCIGRECSSPKVPGELVERMDRTSADLENYCERGRGWRYPSRIQFQWLLFLVSFHHSCGRPGGIREELRIWMITGHVE